MIDIVNTLYDGTKEEMQSLKCHDCGSSISYSYLEDIANFIVECDCRRSVSNKVIEPPKCIEYFGSKHKF